MADVWGALGQSKPTVTLLSTGYTCPTGKHATVKVVVCNQGAATTFRVSHAPGGATDALSQYLCYDEPIGANQSLRLEPLTLAAGDVIRIYSGSGNLSFTINGFEEDN